MAHQYPRRPRNRRSLSFFVLGRICAWIMVCVLLCVQCSCAQRFGKDDNRSYLEEAGFLQSVVSLLEGYADQVVPDNLDPLPISLADLKIARTAIGVLLNASIGFGEWRQPSSCEHGMNCVIRTRQDQASLFGSTIRNAEARWKHLPARSVAALPATDHQWPAWFLQCRIRGDLDDASHALAMGVASDLGAE